MSIVLGFLITAAVLSVVYVIVFLVLRGGVKVARSDKRHVERRFATVSEPMPRLHQRLTSTGWVQSSPVSSGGSTTYASGPLTLAVSPAPHGGTTVTFLGLVCRSSEVPALEQRLDDAFATAAR
jgi:hypothetical protein